MSFSSPSHYGLRTGLIILLAVIAVAVAILLGVQAWQQVADVKMSLPITIALIVGVVATIALSGGLMTLLFYSARHGHDDLHIGPPDEKAGHDH